jgi:hypothetical protein
MQILVRGVFGDHGMGELGVAALREKNFEVLTHIFAAEPEYTFIEAVRDPGAGDEHALACQLLDEVHDIIEPFDGSVDDAGPVRADHVPFRPPLY